MAWLQDLLTRFAEAFKWWFILQPWEQALRVRAGRHIKKFGGGIHFKVPYLDAIFKQNCRLRITDCGHQTITTRDDRTITLTGQLRYRVADVTPLYTKLHMAEETIIQLIQECIADFVTVRDRDQAGPEKITKHVNEELDLKQYGLSELKFAICDYAVVRTYRLINEGFYNWSDHKLATDAEDEV